MSASTFGKPSAPVISTSECAATLTLVRLMLRNLVERGDLPGDVLLHVDAFEQYIAGLKLRSSKRHDDWVDALVVAALLPSFEPINDADAEQAWATLERLVQKRAA